MHGIAAITGNMHRSLRYFVLLEHITSLKWLCMVQSGRDKAHMYDVPIFIWETWTYEEYI